MISRRSISSHEEPLSVEWKRRFDDAARAWVSRVGSVRSADCEESATALIGMAACADEAGTDEARVALGVKAELISRYGAVSPEVAQAMAVAVRELFRADIGIGITGLGLVETSPAEVVYIGISGGKSMVITSRPRGKRRVTNSVLFELRKLLLQDK